MKTKSGFTLIELVGAVAFVALIVVAAVVPHPLIPLFSAAASTLKPTLEPVAKAALEEYDYEVAELARAGSKNNRVRPIVVGYEMGTEKLSLLVLFPSDTWYPTFGVRFSERRPVSPADSLSSSYASSTPAIVHAHGFFPAGSIGLFKTSVPEIARENITKIKALELFDADFRPLGVVPIEGLHTAYIMPTWCLDYVAWLPLLRFYGTFPSAWLADSEGLPLPSPLTVKRPSREQVEKILRGAIERESWLAGHGFDLGVAK